MVHLHSYRPDFLTIGYELGLLCLFKYASSTTGYYWPYDLEASEFPHHTNQYLRISGVLNRSDG